LGNGFSFSRRDALKFIGGLAVGAIASPLPWKLLDDVSIWTQNEGWAPTLPRGPVTTIRTHCPLCPAGCGIKVSMVAGSPFAITGAAGHPSSGGKLCALGLCGHHLIRHPSRLTRALLRERGGTVERSLPAMLGAKTLGSWIRQAARSGSVIAVVDTRPERSLSHLYRSLLSGLPSSSYVALEGERIPVEYVLERTDGVAARAYADLARAANIVSFGAPLLEGWGSVGALSSLMTRRDRGGPYLTQVEPRPSATARGADKWLQPRPGTESLAAMAIGRAVLDGLGERAGGAVPGGDGAAPEPGGLRLAFADVDVAAAAAACGLSPDSISEAARRFLAAPSVAIPGIAPGCGQAPAGLEAAVMALNAVAGRIGAIGGIGLAKPLAPPPGLPGSDVRTLRRFDELADGSVGLLIIDDTGAQNLPTAAEIARKLDRDRTARVVLMSAFRDEVLVPWDLLLPVEGPYEAVEEILSSADSPGARYGLSVPLSSTAPTNPSRAGALAAAFSAADPGRAFGAASLPREVSGLIEGRVGAIFEAGEGVIVKPGESAPKAVREAGSAKELLTLLKDGAIWLDDAAVDAAEVRGSLPAACAAVLEKAAITVAPPTPHKTRGAPTRVSLEPFGIRALTACAALPPAMSKLTAESDLLPDSRVAFMNPETGRAVGVGDNDVAELVVDGKPTNVIAVWDAGVLPEVVHVSARADRRACTIMGKGAAR